MQFKTKARAVDLLGKGQIADLPTAISELWKNGYDAYSKKLGVTLYTEGYEDVKNPFFVVSDDGKGMSHYDIENKWLILGTDSKSRGKKPGKGPETLWLEPRPIMGEKGIGRLSVAYLGSPMLMLSKKIGHPLEALYFDWRTLENYNLYLDDVHIPISPIINLDDFSFVINELKQEFLSNLIDSDPEINEKKKALWLDQEALYYDILNSTQNLQLPTFFEEEIVREFIGNADEIHGTKFIIFEPHDQLLSVKKWISQLNNSDDEDIETVNDIRTGLVGFHNEFKYDIEDAPIKTSFIIKDKTGERDFIGNNAFFSSSDFEGSDHLIEGKFDEFGTFTGTIRVYKEVVTDYKFYPNRPSDRPSKYGKLEIKLGYVPGKNHSILSDEAFKYFDDKLDASGGLYIYRDDLRVLPYGRPNADFLGFEEQRSKHAGTYFFSYRRMFGYIGLTREANSQLRDKAGREGFINNAAFQELKTDLKAFFKDLAKEYFATNARQDLKDKQLEEITAAKKNEAIEKEKEKEERESFKRQIKDAPKKLSVLKSEYEELNKKLKIGLSQPNSSYHELQYLLRQLDELQSHFNLLLPAKPKRFKLNNREEESYETVVELYDSYRPIIESSLSLRSAALERIEESQLLKEYENKFNQYRNFLAEITLDNQKHLKEALRKFDLEFDKTKDKYIAQLDELYHSNSPTPATRESVKKSLKALEEGFNELSSEYKSLLETKSNHLLRLNFEVDDDALVGHYKTQYEDALKQLSDFKNLAQLGIAVEIINHELNSMYGQVSTSINTISKYLSNTAESQKHYKYLKNAFEHLDSKYKSLNPLYRKARRTKQYVKGSELKNYLINFFEESFNEDKIFLNSTKEFDLSETYTFESVLLPALINVINNAIYWLRSVNNRTILLDYEPSTKTIIICNSGPSIKESKLGEIFELFYTRRPKGRGIGLYLSKDILNTVGLDICATNNPHYNKLNGASFLIFPK